MKGYMYFLKSNPVGHTLTCPIFKSSEKVSGAQKCFKRTNKNWKQKLGWVGKLGQYHICQYDIYIAQSYMAVSY